MVFISIVAHEEAFQYFNPTQTPEKIFIKIILWAAA
jgi:hypothetical protein